MQSPMPSLRDGVTHYFPAFVTGARDDGCLLADADIENLPTRIRIIGMKIDDPVWSYGGDPDSPSAPQPCAQSGTQMRSIAEQA